MKSSPFVGRDKELLLLEQAYLAAADGGGQTVFVRGELGIGKSRLIGQFVECVAGRGGLVAEGRWYESEQMPAYVGFREALWRLIEDGAVSAALDPASPYVRDLANLGPEFVDVLGVKMPQADADDDPYRLWRGIALLLRAASSVAPVVLVLDDLQWADRASLDLLGFLGGDVAALPVLIAGAYRDDDVGSEHQLSRTMAALRQVGRVSAIDVVALDRQETAALARSISPTPMDGSCLDLLYERTKGNPLFVEEMLRHLQSLSPAAGELEALLAREVPETVRDVINRRVAELSAECQYVLQLAACVGREFDLGLVERASELDRRPLLALVNEASGAAIILEGASGAFSFAHPLMRETVYHAMPASNKMALHERIAVALEDHYGAAATTHAREIAQHLISAGSLADQSKAIAYCFEGARQARRLFAFEEARRLIEAALTALDRSATPLPRLRAGLLLELGYAETVSGRPDEALACYRDARRTYQELHDEEGRTNAYRWMATTLLRYGRWAEAAEVTREGLAEAREGSTYHYLGLAGSHALAMLVTGHLDESAAWARKLLELSFDNETRAVAHHALSGQHSWGALDPAEAMEHFERSRKLFLGEGRDATSAQVALDQTVAAYILGRFATSDEAAAEAERLGRATGRLSVIADLHALRTLQSVHRAEWEAAHAAHEAWRELRSEIGGTTIYGQLAVRAIALERLWKEGPDAVEADAMPTGPLRPDALRAAVLCEAGRQDEARELLAALKGSVPKAGRGFFWLSYALPLTAVCTSLEDLEVAGWLEALSAYTGCLFDWFHADIELARAAALRQQWDVAEEHFCRAETACGEGGLRAFAAQAGLYRGLMYLQRRAAGDRRRGVALVQEAAAALRDAGLEYQAARADAIVARPVRGRPSDEGPSGLTQREVVVLGLVAQGKTNREIAKSLFISERTVERHLENIYRRQGTRSRGAAVARYLQDASERAPAN